MKDIHPAISDTIITILVIAVISGIGVLAGVIWDAVLLLVS